MPDASVVLARATRINRIVFTSLVIGAVVSFFVLARGFAGEDNGWLGFPGRRLFIVTSGSMSPAIHVGDAVIIKSVDPAEARNLALGTLVTFRASNNPRFLITHRITAVGSSAGGQVYYETKGDANDTADASSLDPSRIEGTVTRVVPRLGSILVALRTPRILGIFVIGFLFFEGSLAAFQIAAKREDDVAQTNPS
jgi:signal peptidase